MDWGHIRVFLSVARTGQFLAAARRLNVDHATVSRRISALERDIGARLFDRRALGSVLTPAGDRLLIFAEQVETKIFQAQAEVRKSDVDVSGTVRIGVPDVFGTVFLSAQLGKLKARYPRLAIQVVPISRALSFSKREADVAIMIGRPKEGRLAVRKLVDYSLHFYASKTYLAKRGTPGNRSDLRQHSIVTYVQDLLVTDQLNFVPEFNETDMDRLECASAIAQISAVRSGAGIGILHDYAIQRDSLLQIILPSEAFLRSYWLVTHLDIRDISRIRAVTDFIAAEVAAQRGSFETKFG
jgi:DNA-binding transcriptional LysR family regulator